MTTLLSKNSKLYFFLIYILLTGIFLMHYLVSGQAVYGDGVGYYSYMHSWYFDFDNDFTNEYKHVYNYQNNNAITPQAANEVQIVGTNKQGKALNHFSPGMAVLLMPFYVVADVAVVGVNFLGAPMARNGYSNLYQIISGMGAIAYVVAAVWLSEKLLQLFKIDFKTRRLTVLTLLFATNLLYYGSFDVINSHFASFFLATLFFVYFFKHRQKLTISNYFILGIVAGLMTITRPQDGLVSLVILIDALALLKNDRKKWFELLKKISAFSLPVLVLLTPLIVQWFTTFDSAQSHPYFLWVSDARSSSLLADAFGTLFNFTNGLFFRTPILFLAAAIFLYRVRQKKTSYPLKLLALFFALQYLVIVFQGGWKAAAYGGRMYISSLPFFLVLIAQLLEWIGDKYSNHIRWAFVIFFISLNIVSITSFVLFEKEASDNKRGTEVYTFERMVELFR